MKRVQELQSVPISVAEYFAALIAKGERRSALRDYLLFGLGLLVPTVIATIQKFVGLG